MNNLADELYGKEPATDDQIWYIRMTLDNINFTDEQLEAYRERLIDITKDEAAKLIEELNDLEEQLRHPRFGAGKMSPKDFRKYFQ